MQAPRKALLRVLNAAIELTDARGVAPTQEEIGEQIGIKKATVGRHLKELAAARFVEMGAGHRSLRVLRHPDGRAYRPAEREITDPAERRRLLEQLGTATGGMLDVDLSRLTSLRLAPDALSVITTTPADRPIPLKGEVHAGPAHEAIEWSDELVPLPNVRFTRDTVFALRVRGDSMEGAGILEGDVVLCEPVTDQVAAGTLAVVLVDGDQATLKRVHPAGERVRLEPASRHHRTRTLPAERVTVQARVVGVWREL